MAFTGIRPPSKDPTYISEEDDQMGGPVFLSPRASLYQPIVPADRPISAKKSRRQRKTLFSYATLRLRPGKSLPLPLEPEEFGGTSHIGSRKKKFFETQNIDPAVLKVPCFVHKMIIWLEKNGANTEGIFRITASQKKVEDLLDLLETGSQFF